MIIAQLARTCYPFHAYGGLERHVYNLALELARAGHTVHLFTQPADQSDLPILEAAWQTNVIHHFVKYSTFKFLRKNSIPDRLVNYPLFSLRLAKVVREVKPDIVHAHGLAGYGYSRNPSVPLILNPHGMEEFKHKAGLKDLAYLPFRVLLRQTARRANRVIATDAALVSEVQRNLKVPLADIVLIPNAVSLPELDAIVSPSDLSLTSDRYNLADSSLIFLSVGRLEANKGFDVMLEALYQTGDQLAKGWRWLIVGEGSQLQFLENLTAKYGLTGKVSWLGGLDNVTLHALYDLADIFVQPTRFEGSSLVTLEALAHHKPVIASRTGGLPDKVHEQGLYENGRLFEPGNVSQLARLLTEFAAYPKTHLRQLGDNGRSLVAERFTWLVAAHNTLEMYTNILQTKS